MQTLGYAQAARQLEDAGELPDRDRDAEIRKRINHDQARSWTTWAVVDGPPA